MEPIYKRPPGPDRVVIVSAFQDFRSKKKASIHQIASALVQDGYDVSFISTRFSRISRYNNDPRNFLFGRENRIEIWEGVRCFLWKTTLHPFSVKNRLIKLLMYPFFHLYKLSYRREVDVMLTKADYIIFESGAAVLHLSRIKRLNSHAKVIYYAADLLETVGAHPFIEEELDRCRSLIDHVTVRSKAMASSFPWAVNRIYKATFGVNELDYKTSDDSPYTNNLNAISVGSMLFDKDFFLNVPPLFPEVDFHVIGCGMNFEAPSNVHIYPEMPFKQTLPYMRFATLGLAPYLDGANVEYLAESSLKLAQYEYFQIPAVCPNFAVGDVVGRFGYTPGSILEIKRAVELALKVKDLPPRAFMSWSEVSRRVLKPNKYLDEVKIQKMV